MMWCSLVKRYRYACIHREDGGSRFLRNVGTHSPNYKHHQSPRSPSVSPNVTSCFLTKYHVMKCEAVELQHHAFLTSELDASGDINSVATLTPVLTGQVGTDWTRREGKRLAPGVN